MGLESSTSLRGVSALIMPTRAFYRCRTLSDGESLRIRYHAHSLSGLSLLADRAREQRTDRAQINLDTSSRSLDLCLRLGNSPLTR